MEVRLRTVSRDVFEDNMVEAKVKAKATKFCPRGRGQSSRTPIPGFFYRATLRRERLCHVVYLSITLKFNALLPPLVRLCMNYEVLYLWYWVLYLPYSKNSTSYGQISKPKSRPCIVEAKARGLRGQGQGHKSLSSSCPRGRGQSSRTPSLTVSNDYIRLSFKYSPL